MKKSDLKTGMIVETREGELHIVVNDRILGKNHWNKLSNYNENLKSNRFNVLDIIKVYNINKKIIKLDDIFKNPELIWERKEWIEVDFFRAMEELKKGNIAISNYNDEEEYEYKVIDGEIKFREYGSCEDFEETGIDENEIRNKWKIRRR